MNGGWEKAGWDQPQYFPSFPLINIGCSRDLMEFHNAYFSPLPAFMRILWLIHLSLKLSDTLTLRLIWMASTCLLLQARTLYDALPQMQPKKREAKEWILMHGIKVLVRLSIYCHNETHENKWLVPFMFIRIRGEFHFALYNCILLQLFFWNQPEPGIKILQLRATDPCKLHLPVNRSVASEMHARRKKSAHSAKSEYRKKYRGWKPYL